MSTTAKTPASPLADDVLYEVIDGEIREKSPMGAFEGVIANVLGQILGPFCRSHRLGKVVVEVLFRIDTARNLQRRPDVAFVSYQRWPRGQRIPRGDFWDVVPELAVEIVSPSNAAAEVNDKVHEYFEAGVQRVWVVFPGKREVYDYGSPKSVHILQASDELDGGLLFPGFRTTVSALFDEETD